MSVVVATDSASSESCAQGFVDYDLLKIKASQIPAGGVGKLSDNILWGGRTYVMPSLSFNCSGRITGFFLGGDIRTDGSRNQYPWVGLFTEAGNGLYNFVSGSGRFIFLSADNFSTDGLLEYKLDQPIDFEDTHFLGVHQPSHLTRVLTLFYYPVPGQHIYDVVVGFNGIYYRRFPNMGQHRFNSAIILHPITSKLRNTA